MAIGHVHQRSAQAPDVGAALEMLVRGALYITAIALEQAHNPIVSPAAVTNGATEVDVGPPHCIRRMSRRRHGCADFFSEIRADSFIGIAREHPLVARGRNRGVALPRNRMPRAL